MWGSRGVCGDPGGSVGVRRGSPRGLGSASHASSVPHSVLVPHSSSFAGGGSWSGAAVGVGESGWEPPNSALSLVLGGGLWGCSTSCEGVQRSRRGGGQAVHPSICCVPSAPLPKIISPPNCPSRRPSSRNHPGGWARGGALGEGGTKRGGDPHRGILLGGGLGTPWGILDEGCRTLGEFMGVLRGVWGPQLGFRGLSPCGGAVGVSTGVSAEVSVGVSAGVSTGGPGGVPPSVPPISRAVREVTAQETAAPSPPGPPAAASEGAPTPGDAAEGG